MSKSQYEVICRTSALSEAKNCLNTPLVLAIRTHKIDVVEVLLKNNTELLSKFHSQLAFEFNYWDCVLLLLKHGGHFPEGLDVNLIPRQQHELLKFISICRKYTNLIKNSSLDKIKKAIDAKKITKAFRSLDNQSAVSLAFRAQCYESYVFLKFKGFSQFIDEAPLEINKLSTDAQFRIKRVMMLIAKNFS